MAGRRFAFRRSLWFVSNVVRLRARVPSACSRLVIRMRLNGVRAVCRLMIADWLAPASVDFEARVGRIGLRTDRAVVVYPVWAKRCVVLDAGKWCLAGEATAFSWTFARSGWQSSVR